MAGVLDELLQNVEQNRIDWANVKTAIVAQGIDVPDETPTSEYGDKILSIESGVDTSGDTVVPSALREGYTAHNAAGQPITGTIPDYSGGNTVEMTSPDGATLNTAGTYCEADIEVIPKLQSKTATTGEIVTADDGYVGLESVDTTGVFEAGQKSEYDAFWDAYQLNGASKSYAYAFAGSSWTDSLFEPKYPIIPTNATYMFAYTGIKNLDFEGLSFSQCSNFTFAFQWASVERLGVVDMSQTGNSASTFYGCEKLTTIRVLRLRNDGSINFSNSFGECKKLETLLVEGVIGRNGFNVSWSPLSKASLTSIVNALSSTATGLTVTLRLAAVNTAFETSAGAADGSTSDEWTALIATKPNWTINLINS